MVRECGHDIGEKGEKGEREKSIIASAVLEEDNLWLLTTCFLFSSLVADSIFWTVWIL